ncbi:MAG: hypothetical protein ACK559_28925, partial [bacterium]
MLVQLVLTDVCLHKVDVTPQLHLSVHGDVAVLQLPVVDQLKFVLRAQGLEILFDPPVLAFGQLEAEVD